MKYLLICLVFIGCAVPVQQEKTINLNKRQLMVVYQNAYLKGIISAQKGFSDDLPLINNWSKDSTDIVNYFFPNR